MFLTVLGNQGPYPGPGGGTSGYLIREGDDEILMEVGSGVLARFLEIGRPERLKGVILSHLHFDHLADLSVLRYLLEALGRQGQLAHPLPIYAPTRPTKIRSLFLDSPVFEPRPLVADQPFVLGSLDFRAKPTSHSMPCLAVRVQGPNGVFVYTADTGPSPEVGELAQGADLLLAEATWVEEQAGPGATGHLKAREAAELALRSGVRRALLTHLWPENDPTRVLEEARTVWKDVGLAEIGRNYTVGGIS